MRLKTSLAVLLCMFALAAVSKASDDEDSFGTEGSGDDYVCGRQPIKKKRSENELVVRLLDLLGAGDAAMSRRIVNGQDANHGQYPWQARLTGFISIDTFCGGTIISRYWVMTAAHCLQNRKGEQESTDSVFVAVGDHDTLSDTEHEDLHEVEKIVVHPLYTGRGSRGADIALIKLKEPITFNDYTQPACLPAPTQEPESSHCLISGWGHTEHKGEGTDVLQGAEIKLESREECTNYLRKNIGGLKYMPECQLETMICAGYRSNIDTCQGDSGGPLVCDEYGVMTVFGVTSFGIGCGREEHAGIYAAVEKFLDWINDTVDDDGDDTLPEPSYEK